MTSLARPRAALPRLPTPVALGLVAPGLSVNEGKGTADGHDPTRALDVGGQERDPASRQGPRGKGWQARPARQGVWTAYAPYARVRTEVCVGEPAREIIRVSLRDRVGLIVMGSHKVRPDRAARWGTTSYKVGIFCQCPILLVK